MLIVPRFGFAFRARPTGFASTHRVLATVLVAAALLAPGASRAQTSADSTVTLTWTAPGDDGNSGTATYYDLRYRTVSIAGTDTASWWGAATRVTGMPAPHAPGSADSVQVRGLTPLTTYYFIIRDGDELRRPILRFRDHLGELGLGLAGERGARARGRGNAAELHGDRPRAGTHLLHRDPCHRQRGERLRPLQRPERKHAGHRGSGPGPRPLARSRFRHPRPAGAEGGVRGGERWTLGPAFSASEAVRCAPRSWPARPS